MKHIATYCLFIAALFGSQNAAAQAAAEPGLMVLSEQKCDYTNMDELGALQDSVFTPTLNAFVDEGKLIDWGVLVHEWGDEWNWNIYYTAESHAAFVDFWAEYVDRREVTQAPPSNPSMYTPVAAGRALRSRSVLARRRNRTATPVDGRAVDGTHVLSRWPSLLDLLRIPSMDDVLRQYHALTSIQHTTLTTRPIRWGPL